MPSHLCPHGQPAQPPTVHPTASLHGEPDIRIQSGVLQQTPSCSSLSTVPPSAQCSRVKEALHKHMATRMSTFHHRNNVNAEHHDPAQVGSWAVLAVPSGRGMRGNSRKLWEPREKRLRSVGSRLLPLQPRSRMKRSFSKRSSSTGPDAWSYMQSQQ